MFSSSYQNLLLLILVKYPNMYPILSKLMFLCLSVFWLSGVVLLCLGIWWLLACKLDTVLHSILLELWLYSCPFWIICFLDGITILWCPFGSLGVICSLTVRECFSRNICFLDCLIILRYPFRSLGLTNFFLDVLIVSRYLFWSLGVTCSLILYQHPFWTICFLECLFVFRYLFPSVWPAPWFIFWICWCCWILFLIVCVCFSRFGRLVSYIFGGPFVWSAFRCLFWLCMRCSFAFLIVQACLLIVFTPKNSTFNMFWKKNDLLLWS